MPPSTLIAQYDEVVSYLISYLRWRAKLQRRLLFRPFSRGFFIFASGALREHRQSNLLTSRRPEYLKQALRSAASSEDRNHVFFQIATSDYMLDSISSVLSTQFPSTDFGRLKELHDLTRTHLKTMDFVKPTIGFVLAAATLLLKTVPQVVVERFGIDYGLYQVWTFYATLILLFYLIGGFYPAWLKISEAKSQYRLISDILSYLATNNRSA